MAALQSSTFTVELNEDSENILRAARRLIFNADYLKAAKLCTGDIVVLSNGDMSSTVRFYSLNLRAALGDIALNYICQGQLCGGGGVAFA